MKKILSILIFVIGAYSCIYAKSTVEITAKVNPSGLATVKVGNKSSTSSITNDAASGSFIVSWPASLEVSVNNINSDYYFTGWTSETMPGGGTSYSASSTSWTYELKHSQNLTETHTVTANLKPYWNIAAGSLFAYEDEDGNLSIISADVDFSLYGASSITATLANGTLSASNFDVTSPTDNTDGTKTVTVSYVGTGLTLSDVVGKNVKLTLTGLTGDNEKSKTIDVSIIETPSLTFIGSDKGAYTITSLKADWDGETVTLPILNPSQLMNIPITLTEDYDDEYIFLGWNITPEGGTSYMNYNDDIKITLAGSTTIEPIFIPNTCAFMVMYDNGKHDNGVFGMGAGWVYDLQLSDINTLYYDLHQALLTAENNYNSTGKKQFVVFDNLATIFAKFNITRRLVQPSAGKEGTLSYREGGYTIPKGVTLLIPGSPNYEYVSTSITLKSSYFENVENSVTPSGMYRKLVVADNTKIHVEYGANISIFAHIKNKGQTWSGIPFDHGQIELGKGCEIILGNSTTNTSDTDGKAELNAFGYVTNTEEVVRDSYSTHGKVVAYAGSYIHEIFQYTNWRGGSIATELLNDKRVFPIPQYYVQNVEAPIIFHSGAQEYVTAMAYVSSMTLNTGTTFISGGGVTGGFLSLGTGTYCVKYYDRTNDRQVYIVNGNGANESAVSFDNVSLNFGLGVSMNSSDFPLPIAPNFDLEMNNVTTNFQYDLIMLPGSSLLINNGAVVNLYEGTRTDGKLYPASVYIYDQEQSYYSPDGGTTKWGYMGSITSPVFQPLFYTPNGSQTNAGKPYATSGYKRTYEDAHTMVDIRGLVNVGKDYNSTSVLYTTEGFEQIVSEGEGGKIKFYNIHDGSTQKYTYQHVNATNAGFVSFPVTNAVLTNGDGTTVTTASAAKGTLYTYTNGEWVPSQGWTVSDMEVTLPSQTVEQDVVYAIDQTDTKLNEKTFTASITGTGFSIVGDESLTFSTTADLSVKVKYTAQNIHNLTGSTGTLTLYNSDFGITYTTPIKAIENYTPKFTTTSTAITMPMTYIGSNSEVTASSGAFQIAVVDGNVTSLINDTETEYYASISWSAESTNNQFVFTFGEGRNALSDAKITFTPTEAGSQSATITLTATYTDANSNKVKNTEEVTLVVNAEAANLATNTLELTDNCISELQGMCVNVPVTLEFENKTANIKPLLLTFEDNDPAVLTYTGTGTAQDPFIVTANVQPTTMPTIVVTQETDYESGVGNALVSQQTEIKNCYPDVQWHWSDMYFGREYDNPITTNSDGDYTLTLTSITKDGVPVADPTSIMTYDPETKKATILENLTGEYVATFSFHQEEGSAHIAYDETFEANIYAYPGYLPLCVTEERIFTAVNHASTGEVTFNTTTSAIEFATGATWTMTFIGVPDILSFTPTANTQLLIEESANGSSFGTAFYAAVVAGQKYDVELSPSTKFVRFTVVAATSFTSLCVEKLDRVRVTPQILYMPISSDPESSPTTRTITFTYASTKDLNINSSTTDIVVTPNVLSKTTEGEYNVVDVTVSSAATTEYNASLSINHKEGGQVDVDIETYRVPQKLPIQLEEGKDDAKRFHFVTTAYKNAEWDAAQYAIKMQNVTTAADNQPYVTFAFDGAPSFISFVPLVATAATDWKIEESVDGAVWAECTTGATLDAGVLKQPLTYTTRYVCVTYIGTSAEVVQMTKVNILSDQSAIPNPEELSLTEANKYESVLTVGEDLHVTTVNLTNLSIAIDNSNFTISYGDAIPAANLELDNTHIADVFGEDVVGAIPFKVFWNASQATDFGTITFTTVVDGQTTTLATVPLVGTTTSIGGDEKLYTGVKTGYTLKGTFDGIYGVPGNDGTEYRPVDLSKTYDANGKPLFDYLIIYGETTTTDGSTTITIPTTTVGSNAKTPVYIYVSDDTKYNFAAIEENANVANKMVDVMEVANANDQELRVYITGFCPYASTGYTKEDEGVWYFRGENGAKLHIYLDDCYLYSRHKTVEGRAFNGRYDGQAFSEGYVRGSGGVLVLENQDNNNPNSSFDVTIHTRRNNMFKSNYGCFFELMQGMRAFQVSSPLQVRLTSDAHKANSKTTVTFDDKWPTDATDYNSFERTNGRISLQKQHNNAPSIDLGNANTIVTFNGGQVELQNAAVVSPNYKTTFAISFRSGLMAGFPMALGIGTDDVGGEINFYDGTTTVIPMEVDIKYRDYYLMDKDANGQELSTTSCLRCPTNTRVYGGSHCMMRACEDVTSKGGAPLDENGTPLGIYKYPKTKSGTARGGFGEPNEVGLVVVNDVPDGYNVESVTPNTNGTDSDASDDYLNFWFTTDEESSVTPEVDKQLTFWKACMTEISAEYMSYDGGIVGGYTKILPNEEIKYLLYCKIDENISDVITAGSGEGDDRTYTYMAPVKDPTGQLETPYLSIPPSYVGDELQNDIETVSIEYDEDDKEVVTVVGNDYQVTDQIYYVVPATADIWMTFTPPFDVEKLWIVETRSEEDLEKDAENLMQKVNNDEDEYNDLSNMREAKLKAQAEHNADFAAFFGVTMALGRDQLFEDIYKDYIGWAKLQDDHTDDSDYTKRGKMELVHYNGSNFTSAHYYLYKNTEDWTFVAEDQYQTHWEVVGEVAEGYPLMEKGKVYSLLFPYCTGCDVEKDENGDPVLDENGLPKLVYERDYWDYWSGKLLIFESTQASSEKPHVVNGSSYHTDLFKPASTIESNKAILTGNSTFATMKSNTTEIDSKIYSYLASLNSEGFGNLSTGDVYQQIEPTSSFLIANPTNALDMPAKKITRDGKIIYDTSDNPGENDPTGGSVPTIAGNSTIFITAIDGGINIAVSSPQHVTVISSTGMLLYNGHVASSVDVNIATNGIYVVKGENEVRKIMY